MNPGFLRRTISTGQTARMRRFIRIFVTNARCGLIYQACEWTISPRSIRKIQAKQLQRHAVATSIRKYRSSNCSITLWRCSYLTYIFWSTWSSSAHVHSHGCMYPWFYMYKKFQQNFSDVTTVFVLKSGIVFDNTVRPRGTWRQRGMTFYKTAERGVRSGSSLLLILQF